MDGERHNPFINQVSFFEMDEDGGFDEYETLS